MSIIDTFLSLIAPHHCVGCGLEGVLLCNRCANTIVSPASRCYRCHKLTENYRTCVSCRSSSRLYAVIPAMPYESYAKELVASLKFNGAQAAAHEMALAMQRVAKPVEATTIIPAPTTSDRRRSRGYDQAVLLAREVSKLIKVEYVHILERRGTKHQVGASRQVRIHQLKTAFYVSNPGKIMGKHVLLVDDVCTTGATLEAASEALHRAGAKRISALVYAQA